MCRKINIFYPCLLGGFYVLSIVVSLVLAILDVGIPLWLNLLLSQGMILGIALIYVLVCRINIFKALPYRRIHIVDAILSILIGYMIVPLVLFISNITMLFATNHVQESTTELTSYPFIVQIILMACIPPLVEEFVCRGLFYHSYRKNGILKAAVASALVFGVLHMNINQFAYAFVIGIIFALMVEATGSIWSSVLAHFSFNTYSIIMLKVSELLLGEEATATETEATLGAKLVAIVMLGIMACVFTLVAFLLFMLMAKRNKRWDYLVNNLKLGFKPRNSEKVFDLGYIITTVTVMVYMVYSELMLMLMS